jgi:hypothetical protein
MNRISKMVMPQKNPARLTPQSNRPRRCPRSHNRKWKAGNEDEDEQEKLAQENKTFTDRNTKKSGRIFPR